MSRRRRKGPIVVGILSTIILLGFVVYILFFNTGDIFQPSLGVPTVGQNWAGYVTASSLFLPQPAVTQVSASWVIPSVHDIGKDAYSSAWIGIGGQFDRSLIQAGTEQDFVNGTAKYYFWYELLPNTQVPINTVQVSPGDNIEISISLVDANTNTWSISLSDKSTGKSFQQNFQYNALQLSAEWIVEAPTINSAIANLANFGTITFTNCQATISGKTGSINSFAHNTVFMQPVIQNNQGIQVTNVSTLSDNGRQFSVSY